MGGGAGGRLVEAAGGTWEGRGAPREDDRGSLCDCVVSCPLPCLCQNQPGQADGEDAGENRVSGRQAVGAAGSCYILPFLWLGGSPVNISFSN